MLWGYAGVFPGKFGIWDGDQTMNMLRFAVKHGFRSAHISLREMTDAARRDQIAAFVAEHDLQLTVGYHGKFFDESLDVLRRQADEFLENLGRYGKLLRVPIVTTGAGRIHRFLREPNLAQQLERLAAVFTPVAQACHALGCPLGIENHGDYYCSDLVALSEQVPHLGIFFDTGNTYLIGEQSLPACRTAAPYVIGTHFKDHHVHPDPKTLTFVIEGAALGEGDVGLAAMFAILREHAPRPERLVMQWEMVPPREMDPYECLERSWRFIRSLPGAGFDA